MIVIFLVSLNHFWVRSSLLFRGATTDSQKVEVLESLITDFTSNVYGYGSGGGINKLTHRNWNGTWTVSDSTAANEVTRIGQIIESTDTNWKKLINGGKISVLSNSEPTISPNYSTVNIDYLCLDVTIELSANEHFEYMIAAYQVEKNNATKEEAEAGEDNTKTMTPLRTKQQIDKRMATKEEVTEGTATDKLVSPATLPKYLSVEVGDWVALTLNPGFIAADSSIPQYRITSYRTGDVVKKLVEFRGAVTLSTGTIDSVFNTISAATIESELRPAQKVMVSCSTNVLSVVGRVHIAESGNIMIGQNSGQSVNYLYLNNLRYWLD